MLAWGLAFGGAWFASAETGPASTNSEAARVEQLYTTARQEYSGAQTNVQAAWQFSRACFDRAEFSTNSTERAALAEQGMAACRRALAQKPQNAAAHYYLAMNLGQLARTRLLSALGLVDEIEREFKTARSLDEHFDFAGPDRNLGLLYHDAPGWPVSVGSRTKARHHLRRAVELAPKHPENRLCLLEACEQWGDHNGMQRELKALVELWPVARTNLVGEVWTAAWEDWEKRLKLAKAQLEKPSNTLTSPRQKN
jgi:tetratricopeptide (TPR) repeat protein